MIALDLFAGSGWGVACQRLGIEEYGVEIMPEARATREANGMHTIYDDVWEGLMPKREARKAMGSGMIERHGSRPGRALDEPAFTIRASAGGMEPGGFRWEETPRVPDYDLLIASPPCQTFSMAGSGAGRKALDEVLAAIDDRLYMDPSKLRAFGEKHDPRTALVLTPLAHVYRDTPTYVVLEQVPPVLPVWERYAAEMRRWGYSVWTGNLQAEMYGVPQTRKRAVLIARADGVEAAPPAPTHSRYHSRDPKRLDEGVLPWVSMAEALGWGMTERPFVTAGNAVGRAEGIGGSGGKAAVQREKMREAWQDRPATTVAGDSRVHPGGHKRNADDERRLGEDGAAARYADRAGTAATRVTVAEAAALQSYPEGFTFAGTKTKQFLQIGNAVPPLLAEAILSTLTGDTE